ncbi:MAG: KpsF/GutQ family sugar-phosphate isomerase [Bacteroidetes bacterium]|nr:KpsF/GutQ family sugar-phosphate isomerase [Bacteroidota bacterium]MBU1372505.1 KpsF/GutQ family sugar-phosphate isomerase [Bacteroidota bacterium]MBU1485086.1 KpsF/GutQ family sugar-phosphate isomerase [Bacteroidota bacterium]MBU1761788.1 KpsF/GutQ family sugar-phosphate isomerase [Bacteroidota bacterium]MBU2268197.1 KpsF/GutQ family sugar-phosphate isomerase [Bacteroidota bacterium]
MKSSQEILEFAQQTIQIETDAINQLSKQLNKDFSDLVQKILTLKGRVIVTGVGKSAIIAQKLVATFNSTGTPSIFMHAADAVHGDLGIIQKDDLIICLSKSGNTAEIKVLIPLLKQGGNLLACIVGDINSYLAQQSDFIINSTIEVEACPNNLAPTTSTTAQLVMGDALAVALVECRAFSKEDFAKFHPGGALGKRLYLKVVDLCILNEKPQINKDANIRDAILEITKKRLGVVAITDENQLKGVITDGDLRRMMEKYSSFENLKAIDIMNHTPKTIDYNEMAVNALGLMKQFNITQLIVLKDNLYFGVVHLHDLLDEGII